MDSQGLEKVELPNQCLGKKCIKMLPRGKHLCNSCSQRNNSKGKLASASSGRGRKKQSHLPD